MNSRELYTGNAAAAESAIRAGCRFYYGYPITPQNEVPAYMSRRLPEVGGVFLQSESEIAAINMCFGAAAAGVRVMTSSSSPGVSLKQEGISYLAGADLPCVIMNIMRGGPGLGSIAPSQADYFQATRGGGHGDYRTLVLAPYSVQEMVDLVRLAFDLADTWRMPTMILGDGQLGQMMEPVTMPDFIDPDTLPEKPWALTGAKGRKQNIIRSYKPASLEEYNNELVARYEKIMATEPRWESTGVEDADIVIVAYGTCARHAKELVVRRDEWGLNVGLIRPITLWPFPVEPIVRACRTAKRFLVVEMAWQQLTEDVRLAVEGRCPVDWFGRLGGGVPTTGQILEEARRIMDAGTATLLGSCQSSDNANR